MQKKTLYDLLEVSEKASPDAIRAAFTRLTEKHEAGTLDGGMISSAEYYNQIKDAFFTLGNEQKRTKYNQTLGSAKAAADQAPIYASSLAQESVSPSFFKWVLVGLLVVGGGFYYKHNQDTELEARRLEAEITQNRLKEAEIQREKETLAQVKAEERKAEIDRLNEEAARNRAVAERDAYSRRIQREQEVASRAAQWDAERERRQQEQQKRLEAEQQRRDVLEAQRRIDREKALARELEWENRSGSRKGGGIYNH